MLFKCIEYNVLSQTSTGFRKYLKSMSTVVKHHFFLENFARDLSGEMMSYMIF